MANRLTLILTICFFSLASESHAQRGSNTVLKDNLRASVVSVISYSADGNVLSRGAGFFISAEGDVLTRRSLVPSEAARTEVMTAEGAVYQVRKVVREDREADLITVALENPPVKVKPIPSATFSPQFGDKVFVICGDGAIDRQLVEGTVTSVDISAIAKTFEAAGSLRANSSGSPVVDLKGEVVGVVISTMEGGHGFTSSAIGRSGFLYPQGAAFQPTGSIKENSPAGAVRRGEGLFQGTAITRVAPAYPSIAKYERVDGTIIVEVLVDESGDVVSARPITTNLRHHAGKTDEIPPAAVEALKQAAVDAVRQWKFAPTTVEGKRVKVLGTITLYFHL